MVERNSRQKNLETCLVITTGLLLLYWLYEEQTLVIAAFGVSFVGAFVNPVATWITRLWDKLTDLLGGFTTKIVLVMVFFLLLTPLALLYRLVQKDPLQRKKKNRQATYWTTREHVYEAKDLEQLW